MEIAFFVYIALVSSVGVALCVYDKIVSKLPTSSRIRERTLVLLGIIGGAVAMLLTMLGIRHKTQHTAIMVIMGTASVIWSVIYAVVIVLCYVI